MTRATRRRTLQIAIIAVSALVLVPQIASLSGDPKWLQKIQFEWVIYAIGSMVLSFCFSALAIMTLVPGRLSFGRTFVTQLAAGFMNRVIPSGIGAIGINTIYLSRRTKINKVKAATFASINNMVGFVAFCFVGIGVFFFGRSSFQLPQISNLGIFTAIVLCVSALAMLMMVRYTKQYRKVILRLRSNITTVLRSALHHPGRLAMALACNICITLSSVAVFGLCVRAAGVHLSFVSIYLAFAAGVAVIAVSPTPNGLGAAEVVLSSVLTRNGVDSSAAIVIVLMYRVISYWLPLLPGYIAFRAFIKPL